MEPGLGWRIISPMSSRRALLIVLLLLAPGCPSPVETATAGAAAEPVDEPAPPTPRILVPGALVHPRLDTTATLLPDGSVLVVGGTHGAEADRFERGHLTERFDPTTGTSVASHSMKEWRYRHTATLLDDGRVLAVGGINGRAPGAELFDGASWTPAVGLAPTGNMLDLSDGLDVLPSSSRYFHSATLLHDGKVLVCGGKYGSSHGPIDAAHLFTPGVDTWSDATPMNIPRDIFTATRLSDGRVLVVGGREYRLGDDVLPIAKVEAYHPDTDTWERLPPLSQGRSDHAAVLLRDGRVLVVGGIAVDPADREPALGIPRSFSLDSTEIFDPATGTWSAGPSLSVSRFKHTASILDDGTVVVAGGWSSTTNLATSELLRPGSDRWEAGPTASTPRDGHRAVVVDDSVLLVGGQNDHHHALATVDVLTAHAGESTEAIPHAGGTP